MTLPNSSSTNAVPYRSTERIVCGDAWLGETPAAWMRPVTSPSAVAVWTSACTDSRDDTSTVAVLTSNPALLNTSAAASAFSWRKSASRTCLPALTRRAIAWPIDPGPMTTMTSLMTTPSHDLHLAPLSWGSFQVHDGLLQRTKPCQRLPGQTAPSDRPPAAGPPPPPWLDTDALIPFPMLAVQ